MKATKPAPEKPVKEKPGGEPPAVWAADPRLFNVGELARALGVNRFYVNAMIRYGFKMPLGRATVGMALKWLDENKDMLASHTISGKAEA